MKPRPLICPASGNSVHAVQVDGIGQFSRLLSSERELTGAILLLKYLISLLSVWRVSPQN